MGTKYRNLQELHRKKINVHDFFCAKTAEDLFTYAAKNNKFSIRFDNYHNYHSRPFYKIDSSKIATYEEKEELLTKIAIEAEEESCSMLCSNGHQYDDIQICNFVIKVSEEHDFLIEWCTKKVPLRDMYRYKTTVLKGNINDSLKDMVWINKDENFVEDKDIELMLNWAITLECYNKNIEATLYPTEVGIYKERIVCWQTD